MFRPCLLRALLAAALAGPAAAQTAPSPSRAQDSLFVRQNYRKPEQLIPMRDGTRLATIPGFYAAASLPHAHPALRAVSPQAPVTDEFMGDDARHGGAFFLLDNFGFTNFFDVPRPQTTAKYEQLFPLKIADAYQFFLDLRPIENANKSQYCNGRARIWNEYLQHDTYDAYWQARLPRARPRFQADFAGAVSKKCGVSFSWPA